MTNPTPNCHHCRFFQLEDKHGFDADGTTGTCRRHPPSFLPPVAKQIRRGGNPDNPFDDVSAIRASRDFQAWAWPVVAADADHWCGEFTPAEGAER